MIAVKKNNDMLRYVASGVFLLLAISSLIGGLNLYEVSRATGYALVSVSFLVKKPKLATVGAVVLLLERVLIYLISDTLFWYIDTGRYFGLLYIALAIVADIMFIVLTVNREKSMGYAAAGVFVLSYLVGIIFLDRSLPLEMLLWLAGLILAGLVYGDMPKRRAAAPKAAQSSTAGTIQRMEKLQGLLEKGVITQEEFDAKKKQLLGL